MKYDKEKIRQYLLGKLSEKEFEQLDLTVLSEKEIEEELLIAEHELIEAYLENTLSPEDRRLFHQNFLVSDERRSLFRDVSILKQYADGRSAASDKNEEEAPKRLAVPRKNWFAFILRPVPALAAVLLVLILAGIVWKTALNGSEGVLTDLEREYARLNEKNLGDLESYENFTRIDLVPGVYRDKSGPKTVAGENLTESVLVRLALPPEVGRANAFRASVLQDQKVIFTQPKISLFENQSGREARLLLPKSILRKGEYQIRLKSASGEQTISYGLVVE